MIESLATGGPVRAVRRARHRVRLLALVISQTLRHGPRPGRAGRDGSACVTDLPIVVLVGAARGDPGRLVRAAGSHLAGGVGVRGLARRGDLAGAAAGRHGTAGPRQPAPRSWTRQGGRQRPEPASLAVLASRSAPRPSWRRTRRRPAGGRRVRGRVSRASSGPRWASRRREASRTRGGEATARRCASSGARRPCSRQARPRGVALAGRLTQADRPVRATVTRGRIVPRPRGPSAAGRRCRTPRQLDADGRSAAGTARVADGCRRRTRRVRRRGGRGRGRGVGRGRRGRRRRRRGGWRHGGPAGISATSAAHEQPADHDARRRDPARSPSSHPSVRAYQHQRVSGRFCPRSTRIRRPWSPPARRHPHPARSPRC